ncbi:MAG: hypothetical protein C5B54_00915, partial [Acidobacteria bacterium]
MKLKLIGLICIMIYGACLLWGADELIPPADPALKADLIKRREAVANKIGPNSMLILFSSDLKTKTNDVEYEYRQSNNLYYLTGV